MKIAHISDLHLDKTYKRNNYYKTIRLLEYITDNGFDHVILTGDITENAEASAFELARSLFKKFGLLDHRKLTLTIGNHDIYGGVHLAEDVLNFPKKCRATNYGMKVKEFEHYFRETFTGTQRTNTGALFPHIKEFDEFVLLNINSISRYSMLKNPFASNGEISTEQLRLSENLLNSINHKGKQLIVAAHHHFTKPVVDEDDSSALWSVIDTHTMKLRKKKSIIKKFKAYGVNAVLHGHVHESCEYYRKSIRFINGGGSILSPTNDILQVNLINIEKSILTSRINIPYIETDITHLNELSPAGLDPRFLLHKKHISLN